MEGITKIVGVVAGILIILIGLYYSRGFLESGISKAQGILGKTGSTADKTLDNMNKDIILSMTKFTVTIKKGNKVIDSTTILGYSALQNYLTNYNIDITELVNDNQEPLVPETILKAYKNTCSSDMNNNGGGADFGNSALTFTSDIQEGSSEYTAKIIVTLPDCEEEGGENNNMNI